MDIHKKKMLAIYVNSSAFDKKKKREKEFRIAARHRCTRMRCASKTKTSAKRYRIRQHVSATCCEEAFADPLNIIIRAVASANCSHVRP